MRRREISQLAIGNHKIFLATITVGICSAVLDITDCLYFPFLFQSWKKFLKEVFWNSKDSTAMCDTLLIKHYNEMFCTRLCVQNMLNKCELLFDFFPVISKLNTGSILEFFSTCRHPVQTVVDGLCFLESWFLAVLCTAHCCEDSTLWCVDTCAVDGVNDAARCLS